MGKTLFITGTGTDVGKTALSLAVLLWARQRGLNAAYLKPVQCGTFAFGNPPSQGGDADWIRAMAGPSAATRVTYRFPLAASPHLAAEQAGAMVDLGRIRADVEELAAAHDLLLVEGSGGAAVPVNRRGATLSALAAELSLPCLIACAPGLGTLHHTLSTLAFLRALPSGSTGSIPVAGFAFCHRDAAPPALDLSEDNRATLESLTGLPCFGSLPWSAALARGAAPTEAEAAAWSAPLSASLEAWWNPRP
jgi:dethiobiotin synthetase